MNAAELRRLAFVVLPGAVAVALTASVVAFALDAATSGDRKPFIGDHWHAPYAIFVDGTRLPAIPEVITPEGIHTHGDGIIHIHPHIAAGEGQGASLASFFAALGGELSDTEMRVPGHSNVYQDGAIAGESEDGVIVNGEVLRLRILRADSGIHPLGAGFAAAGKACNDKPESEFDEVDAHYVPRDGDCIRIVFGPAE